MYSHIQMWFHNFLFFVPAIFTETQKIQFPLHKPIFMTRTDINKTCFERAPGKCLCSVAWSCADTDRRAVCPLGESHAVVRAAEHSSFNRTGLRPTALSSSFCFADKSLWAQPIPTAGRIQVRLETEQLPCAPRTVSLPFPDATRDGDWKNFCPWQWSQIVQEGSRGGREQGQLGSSAWMALQHLMFEKAEDLTYSIMRSSN